MKSTNADEPELKIEFKTENGIKVFIYPPMWAKGSIPQKNIRINPRAFLK